jgi:soluble lytic murein transglycosylase
LAALVAPDVRAQVTILKGSGDGSSTGKPPSGGDPSGPAIRTPGGSSTQGPGPSVIPGGPTRPAPGGGYVPPVEGGPTIAPQQADTVASALADVALLPEETAKAFAEAIKAVEESRWDDARNALPAAAPGGLKKYVEWAIAKQPKSDVTFAAIVAFLRANPDWPDADVLRRQAEDRITDDTPAAEQIAFFSDFPPLTSAGLMRRMEAAGRAARDQVATLARDSWRTGTFRNSDEITFLTLYGQYLQPSDHIARFDRLMREGRDKVARDLLPKLPDDYRAIAEARLALVTRAPEVVSVLRAVPAAQQQDARLLLDRVRYLRRTGDRAAAISLLMHLPASLTQDDAWWAERQALARDALQAKRPDQAFRLVSAHGLKRGIAFAEAEFLA